MRQYRHCGDSSAVSGYAALMLVLTVSALLMSLAATLSDTHVLLAEYAEALRIQEQASLSAAGCRDMGLLYLAEYSDSAIDAAGRGIHDGDIDCTILSILPVQAAMSNATSPGAYFSISASGTYKNVTKTLTSKAFLSPNSIALVDPE